MPSCYDEGAKWTVVQLVEQHIEELKALCRKYRVQSLYLFGSAASKAFDPDTSDLDFLVSFEAMEPVEHKNAYFGLTFSLGELLSAEIDLVEEAAIRNPYFKEEVEETRVVLYAA